MKTIAVLTSGGDAPGMNAAIRAVVRAAEHHGLEVYGIEQGYNGLIQGYIYPLDSRSVGDIINRGGTVLRTVRCKEFRTPEGRALAREQAIKHGLDGIVAIGGDGTFNGARLLAVEQGIPTIGIPGTIDNDLAYTDYTIGFDTAVNTVLDAIAKIRDTMTSHERISVVEVMGRACGEIAIHAGLTGGAECIIIPEVEWNIEDVAKKLTRAHEAGEIGSVVVVAEGAGKGADISEQIEKLTGIEARCTVLGYIQRGGTATARDTQLGCQFSERAVTLLKQGIGNRVVGIRNNEVLDMDIVEALEVKSQVNIELYNLANTLAL
jgi:6-phosphofructokinase 1